MKSMVSVQGASVAVMVLSLFFAALSGSERAGAQVAKGKSRPAPTKYLMRGISQAHCKGIAELLKDSGPGDDNAWETLSCHASCINELSFALVQDGRCPDGTWAGAAKSLGEGSAAVITAADNNDLDATKSAFKTVTDSCRACHDAHRNK